MTFITTTMRSAAVCAMLLAAVPASAETPEDWIALGTRIHGGFGAFIPLGIRIGLDARERLHAGPRDLTVTFTSGAVAPCACIADGIMIATGASPGQGSLQIAPGRPENVLAIAVIRNRRSGEGVRYTIGAPWMAKIGAWNKTLDPAGRYDAAMTAEGIFDVAPLPAETK